MTAPKESKSKEGFAIAAAAIVGAAVVAAGAFWWTGRDTTTEAVTETTLSQSTTDSTAEATPSTDAPDTTDESSTTDDSTAPDDQFVEHAVCPSGTPAEVCEAAEFVETVRGRAFKSFPLVELVDADEFESRLLADFNEFADELSADGITMSALGLIPQDADLADIFKESISIGVVGFYDTESQELVIKGSDLDLYAELVIVHELTHAFDDQWFDLDRAEVDDLADDASYGFSAVVEGNASRVEGAWRDSLSPDDEAELTRLEFSLLSPEDLLRYLEIPASILSIQISPYTDGKSFVQSVADAGGEDAVDALFLNPPTSSEQVFHPEKFAELEAVVPTEAPEPSGDIIDEGDLGELVLREWLGVRAAEGWGGDSYATWDAGEGESCFAVHIMADTDDDLDEIISALDSWAAGGGGRFVEQQNEGVLASACF